MRLEWLEDILAVLETGSLIRASEQRFLSQPAFSRRIKQIEAHVGAELFDRSKKPVQLKQSVIDQQVNIRELAAGLRDLRNELKRQDRETLGRIIIASQHAITTSLTPLLVRKLSDRDNINIRLRSANHDECYTLLMTKQVDFILVYQSENEQIPVREGIFEQCDLGREKFIPVYATHALNRFKEEYENGDISVVAYPADAFLGQVVNQEIFPHMWRATTIHKKAETALTLAAVPLALSGVGVAWLPFSIVAADLANRKLTNLSDILPACELSIVGVRLLNLESTSTNAAWEIITSHSG
jgi:DNA-binding transcriptional LysR family regulator